MRSIRKVQNDCNLLNICSENNEILDKIYDGFMFDKIYRNDALYQYMVYLPELKMTIDLQVDMIKIIIVFSSLKYIYLQMRIGLREK